MSTSNVVFIFGDFSPNMCRVRINMLSSSYHIARYCFWTINSLIGRMHPQLTGEHKVHFMALKY